MPGIVKEPTPERKRLYLNNLYKEIYIKDLVEHSNVKREDILECILDFLSSSISLLTNANKITNILNEKL